MSRVLNQNDTTVQISDETRQRVLAAVEELGYHPNALARSLRTQRTQTIAMLIADLTNGFYHPMVRTVQDIAYRHGYEVLISNSDHIYEHELQFCKAVSRRPVDGVILVPIHLTNADIDHYFGESHTPIAILGSHMTHPNIDVVYVDDEQRGAVERNETG